MGAILIRKAGLLTTIQDRGRWGWQDRGVPVAGPMDARAHRLANLLLGNQEHAAGLEITLIGPEIEFEEHTPIALTGADLGATLDGAAVPLNSAEMAPACACLRFGGRRAGARAYLGLGGGIVAPLVLGSRATHVVSRMGGIMGRPVAAGDRLDLGPSRQEKTAARSARRRPSRVVELPAGGARLRVLPGPHDEYFAESVFSRLHAVRYTISPQSDRMGYRLEGPAIEHAHGADIISDATPFGGIQVPASGRPILLMADRATTGGYPLIATVITADLPVAAQLAPGDWIEFGCCSRREAMAALIAQERALMAGG